MVNATVEWLPVWVWPLLIVIGLGLLGYVAFRLVRDGTRKTPSANDAVSGQRGVGRGAQDSRRAFRPR